MITYGITDSGFVLKRFDICKGEIEEEFQEVFGANIQLEAESIFGQVISILAKREATSWEKQQAQYNATRPQAATGIPLDDIALINGLMRLAATKSQAYITLFGDDTDVVDLGFTVARSDDETIQFILEEDTTISEDDTIEAQVDITSAASGAYIITIDSVLYTYTAGGGDTLATITAGLSYVLQGALSATHIITAETGTNHRITIRPIDDITSFTVSLTGNLDYNTIGTLGFFYAENAGQVSAPSGLLTSIVTPDDADSVYNRQPASVGRLEETDTELRIRRERAFSGLNGGSIPAIENRMLTEVDGVSFCRVFENDSSSVDSEGRPPNSIEAVVVGGTDSDIGTLLFAVKSGGIATYGNVARTVIDSLGDSHTVNFSRQTTQYVWIRYTVTPDHESSYPSDGAEQIKAAAKVYCDAEFTIGKDLLVNKLAVPAYSIVGVREVAVEVAITATALGTPTYGSINIVLTSKELPEFATTRIVVLEA